MYCELLTKITLLGLKSNLIAQKFTIIRKTGVPIQLLLLPDSHQFLQLQ